MSYILATIISISLYISISAILAKQSKLITCREIRFDSSLNNALEKTVNHFSNTKRVRFFQYNPCSRRSRRTLNLNIRGKVSNE